MYSTTDLVSLYNSWLTQFSTVPEGRVILDGTGDAQNVPNIGSASSLDGCLLGVHDYSFFGSDTQTSESQWASQFQGEVGSYSDRTVCTEWGGPMSPGSKNGISYGSLDYSQTPTNYFEAYIRGVSSQLRAWSMGSFYWAGLKDGDWYSMTTESGTGSNITLSVPNSSGLQQLQNAWTGASPGTGGTAAGGDTGRGGSSAGTAGSTAASTGGSSSVGGRGGTSSLGGRGGMSNVSSTGGGISTGVASGGSSPAIGGAASGGMAVATGGANGASTGGAAALGGGAPAAIGGAAASGGSERTTSSNPAVTGGAGQPDSSTGGPSIVGSGDSSGSSCATGRPSRGSFGGLTCLIGLLGLSARSRLRRRARAANM